MNFMMVASEHFIEICQNSVVLGRDPFKVREVSFFTGRGTLEIFKVLEIFSDPPTV